MTDVVSIKFIDVMLVLVDPRCAGGILCFGLDPLHVCSELRALVGHCGRALVPEKGQWMSVWSPSA